MQSFDVCIIVADQGVGSLRTTTTGAMIGLDTTARTSGAVAAIARGGTRVELTVAAARLEPQPTLMPPVSALRHVSAECEPWLRRLAGEQRAQRVIVVAADGSVRALARALGFTVAPHVEVALWLSQGRSPRFARVRAARPLLEQTGDLLVYELEASSSEELTLWAALPEDSVRRLVAGRAHVELLKLDIELSDPYLLRGPGCSAMDPDQVVWRQRGRCLVAVPPSQPAALESLASRHGAILRLAPSPELLRDGAARRAGLRASERRPALQLHGGYAGPTASGIRYDVERFSGAAALDGHGAISSRHIDHPHSARVIAALTRDLRELGLDPQEQSFAYQGRSYVNVSAELPGAGLKRVSPDAVACMRAGIADPERAQRMLGALRRAEPEAPAAGDVLDLAALERQLGLGAWTEWWRDGRSVAGTGAELIIVGAHFDSTAAASPDYHPTTSAAPGADDDASGIACVLAVARELVKYRDVLQHSVRFCFFNAEEQGLVGSRAYAAQLRAAGAPVKAAICLDMVGYDRTGSRSFELHAGAIDPTLRDACVPIAQLIAASAAAVTTLDPPQIYRGTSSASQPDHANFDPAIGRADHASFQAYGYPAVVVSEDFFVNEPGEGPAEPNPNYHRSSDTFVNPDYASDIARAVLAAVLELAAAWPRL